MFVSPQALLGTLSCSGHARAPHGGCPQNPSPGRIPVILGWNLQPSPGRMDQGVAPWTLRLWDGQGHAVQCPQTWWLWPFEPSRGSLRIPWNSPATAPGKAAAPAPTSSGSSPFLWMLLKRGTIFLDTGAGGTHELSQASFQSPRARTAPQGPGAVWVTRSRVHTAPQLHLGGSNPGAELWGVPKPNQRIPPTRNVPNSRLALCTAACGPWLSPHPTPPSPSWLCPRRAPQSSQPASPPWM